MARRLVICCDGTNNQFGPENTNVVRLVQVLDRNPSVQRLYYDPGVGTLPEPGTWTAVGKWMSKVIGLAFGAEIFWKVQQAYEFLMDIWEPGDQVFLFGFSRGAYTARLLAAVLHQLGLLARGNHNLVPYALRLFKSLPDDNGSRTKVAAHFQLCDQFRWTFARLVPESGDDRRFHIHFLGVWDTVSSVGWAWDPPAYPFTATNPSVKIIRHAVSIDERRWFFRQNLMHSAGPTQDLRELWFPGVHSDVGGGYPPAESRLWQSPFLWILEDAQSAGLAIDPSRLRSVMGSTTSSKIACVDPQHESLTPLWWPAEFFPKLRWQSVSGHKRPAIGLGRHRVVVDGAHIHQCTLERLRHNSAYRPPNLSRDFVDAVCALSSTPAEEVYRRLGAKR